MKLPKVQFKMRKHRKEAAVNAIAAAIPDQQALDVLLAEMDPQTKQATISRMRPFLSFEPTTNEK